MATKLKKSDFRPLLKTILFSLCLLLTFSTAISGLTFLRTGVFFASEDGEIKNTPAFATEIRNTVDSLAMFKKVTEFYAEDLTYAEYIKTQKAKEIIQQYDEDEKRAIKLFETIQELKKLRPENIKTPNGIFTVSENNAIFFNDGSYEYYDFVAAYEEWFEEDFSENAPSYTEYPDTDPITVPADDKELLALEDEYYTYSAWYYKYRQLRNAIFSIVEDAVSIDSIKFELEERKNDELQENYYRDITQTAHEIISFVNVKFILKNNETGNVVSNVDKKDRKSFIKNLASDSLFHIDFDGERLHSEPNKINRSTNLLKFLTDGDILQDENINQSYLSKQFSGYSLYLKINSKELVPGDTYYNIYNSVQELPASDGAYNDDVTLLFFVLSIICFIACCALHSKERISIIDLTFLERIPFVVCLALTCALVGFTGLGIGILTLIDFNQGLILGSDSPFIWAFSPSKILCAVSFGTMFISLVLLGFVLYIIRNIKAKAFSDRFVTVLIFRRLKRLVKVVKTKLSERELTPSQITKRIKAQTIIFFAIFVIMNIVCYLFAVAEIFVISVTGFVLFNSLAIVYAVMYINDVLRLAKFTEEIRNGNLQGDINPEKYTKPLKKFAYDLSACRDGIQTAINEAIKGEHLKTELITNVSHDLKTPLTSIINYVSLLKMGNIEGEEERKYIDILDEKSNKLKRLIEDLTEASKANSGNIKMNIAQVNLNEMALQAVGENSDVLENAGLDVILTERAKEIIVRADSQHTFRIIDNLFSNAKKYSLTGTRVYVDVYKENGFGVFEIKNISYEKLNIAPDELTERFVRGDNSRSTDGSGLGLSIARSFAELQNGSFNIEIDGDMFKAIVKLPLA